MEWLGLRPARGAPVSVVQRVELDSSSGLIGDRYAGRTGARHVTLIQAEHLEVIAKCSGREQVTPELLRRNMVVSGINLLALKDKAFFVGECTLEFTGLCHPCSRMEQLLGPGGYNAVRGHGGITARVLLGGAVTVGDQVRVARVSDQTVRLPGAID